MGMNGSLWAFFVSVTVIASRDLGDFFMAVIS